MFVIEIVTIIAILIVINSSSNISNALESGGSDAVKNAYPWVVLVTRLSLAENGSFLLFNCGGFIITKQWVLSAAHCFPSPKDIILILAGTNKNYAKLRNRRFVQKFIAHRDFDPDQLNNDVALLQLRVKLKFDDTIQPIRLVWNGYDSDGPRRPTFADRTCTVVGWGITDSEGSHSKTLQVLKVRILPRRECILTTCSYQMPVHRDEAKLCAGGLPKKDTCRGDSGGPLFCKHADGQFYVHGITSYGHTTCGSRNKPGVYVKIGAVRNWIQEVLSVENEQ